MVSLLFSLMSWALGYNVESPFLTHLAWRTCFSCLEASYRPTCFCEPPVFPRNPKVPASSIHFMQEKLRALDGGSGLPSFNERHRHVAVKPGTPQTLRFALLPAFKSI